MVVKNGDLQRVASVKNHHLQQLRVLKLYLQNIHGNRRDLPPRMAYLRDNGGEK